MSNLSRVIPFFDHFPFHLFTVMWIGQGRHGPFRPAVFRPERQMDGYRGARVWICVAVERDVDPLGPGLLDQTEITVMRAFALLR